ncbi:MAG: Crp/Fnr family transcriptional regulator [Alphaproteobacteria bacterium]
MTKTSGHRFRNRILACLSAQDYALLEPHLEAVDLPLWRSLEQRNREIDHVYFIESGIASVVANAQTTRSIEVGLIGREGMSGICALLGAGSSPHDTYMQVGGAGLRLPTGEFLKAYEASVTLRRCALKYAHIYMVQSAQTAYANGRGRIEERLSRWLLMGHDRVEGGELPLTHEFLAMMLGVRRPGVTMALKPLEERGLIDAQRGVIVILDRKGLEENAGDFYGVPEAELKRLFG